MATIITTSCPGKVLVVGGYAVLEKGNCGLVIATDARVRCSLKWEIDHSGDSKRMNIYSKNYREMYAFSFDPNGTVRSIPDSPHNIFVAYAVRCSLLWVVRRLNICHENHGELRPFEKLPSRILNIIIDADPRYYRACDGEDNGSKSVKIGLGSSAGIATSIVAAILLHFYSTEPLSLLGLHGVGDRKEVQFTSPEIDSEAFRNEIHFVSQMTHNLAQGKVGSGFDVCCAVFGSGVYTRYSPDLFLGCDFTEDFTPNFKLVDTFDTFLRTTREAVMSHSPRDGLRKCMGNEFFDFTFEPLTTSARDICSPDSPPAAPPHNVYLLLIASTKSTSTVGMVSAFSAAKSSLKDLYESLLHANEEFVAIWRELLKGASNERPQLLQHRAHFVFRLIRSYLKEIGNIAGIPVEPDASTRVLNAIEAVDGVICAGCPGSGGHDAMFVLVDSQDVREEVSAMVTSTHGDAFLPMEINMDNHDGLFFDFFDVTR
ncbi:phosphomevalonate kinase-like protein [Perkinsela sp. CCAP 1560/4]|nr:phosphomevalonate kinase-like protein [Perkinsela sp. CCAP 1560/4]|eukprot:KNH04791.1 phosphomevalonate kinase-like protein [Perkinsela sp. CCAP 1560/4]